MSEPDNTQHPDNNNKDNDNNKTDNIIEYRTYHADTDKDSLLELIKYLQDYECKLYDRMKPSKDYITTKYIDDLLESCKESDGEIIVATVVQDKVVEVVGYAVVLTKVTSKEEEHEIDYTYGEITDLAVHPNYQRRGIAKTLLDQCEYKVKNAGTTYLRTEVLANNNSAISTYSKYGFQSHLITMEKIL